LEETKYPDMIGIDENQLPGLNDPTNQREGHKKVELFISCRELKNLDILSLSDPQVKIFIVNSNKGEEFFGETEIVRDNLNPNFTKTFSMDYIFEKKQNLRFEIIDVDKHGKFDMVGNVFTTLGAIVGSKNQILIEDIIDKDKKRGKLILRTEIAQGTQRFAKTKLAAKNLKNYGGWFSKSSPFFHVSRVHEETTNIIVYQSENAPKNLNPSWKEFELSLQTLCNNDMLRPLLCTVYDKKRFKNKMMGQCTFCIDDLKNGSIKSLELKKPKSNKKNYGSLEIADFSLREKPSFLEYLRRGVQLNVVTAIDFTSSNGNPKSVTSLHSITHPEILNDYQKAIAGVCDILLCYDYDKQVPVYGFGGKPAGSKYVSHCFSLTGDEKDNWAYGLDGIMGIYQNALQNITLGSPTYFASILKKGMDIARAAKEEESKVYTILLILTDGLIHDMQAAKDWIVECSSLPISIIIVGVGNENFTMMEALDCDGPVPLCNSKGEFAKRDLVQFVAFNKFKGDREALAEEVLAEVPRQLVEYIEQEGISFPEPVEIDVNNCKFSRPATIDESPNAKKIEFPVIQSGEMRGE